jgi:DNA-binding response OmpR family regulator
MEQKSDIAGRVIIVEDDADFRDSIVKYLGNRGLDITGVGSAIEFYREVSSARFELAILDLALPDQSGIVLSQYLRANTRMRIVILTAKTSPDERLAGYEAGADLYMVKPVDFRELYATVASLLGRMHEFPADDTGVLQPQEQPRTQQQHQPESQEEAWTLARRNWLLMAPSGEQIKLTSKEYLFLGCLAADQSAIVPRETLLKSLGYENSEYGNRALESLIYRLRKKISPTLDTPIKTASGSGYTFTSPLHVY